MNIYDFTVKDLKGNEVSLSAYKNQVLLVVNTATKCGLTPQYTQLQKLYETYHDRGFEILDFPCNQFMNQAPGSEDNIHEFCTLNYSTTFPRFAKIQVNGKNAIPLYTWLKKEIAVDELDEEAKLFETKIKFLTPSNKPGDIKWNFGKFLIDRNGKPRTRFSPGISPEKLAENIESLL